MIDWFNIKKVKEQQRQIESLKEERDALRGQLILANRTASNLGERLKKYTAPPVTTIRNYTVDAVEFAKSLQMNRKRKICGGGSCAMKYEIPCEHIDKVAKAVVPQKQT